MATKKRNSRIERALKKGFKSGGDIGDIGGGTGAPVSSSGGGKGGAGSGTRSEVRRTGEEYIEPKEPPRMKIFPVEGTPEIKKEPKEPPRMKIYPIDPQLAQVRMEKSIREKRQRAEESVNKTVNYEIYNPAFGFTTRPKYSYEFSQEQKEEYETRKQLRETGVTNPYKAKEEPIPPPFEMTEEVKSGILKKIAIRQEKKYTPSNMEVFGNAEMIEPDISKNPISDFVGPTKNIIMAPVKAGESAMDFIIELKRIDYQYNYDSKKSQQKARRGALMEFVSKPEVQTTAGLLIFPAVPKIVQAGAGLFYTGQVGKEFIENPSFKTAGEVATIYTLSKLFKTKKEPKVIIEPKTKGPSLWTATKKMFKSKKAQVKTPSKRRMTKGELRKQSFNRAYNPNQFLDKQTGEVGARRYKGPVKETIRYNPNENTLSFERKAGKGKTAIQEKAFVKSFKKGASLEERIGTKYKTVGKPKYKDTVNLNTREITREVIFSEKNKRGRGKPPTRTFKGPKLINENFGVTESGTVLVGKTKQILIESTKGKGKRVPRPQPQRQTTRYNPKTKANTITELITEDKVNFPKSQEVTVRKGWRPGQYEKVMARLKEKQRVKQESKPVKEKAVYSNFQDKNMEVWEGVKEDNALAPTSSGLNNVMGTGKKRKMQLMFSEEILYSGSMMGINAGITNNIKPMSDIKPNTLIGTSPKQNNKTNQRQDLTIVSDIKSNQKTDIMVVQDTKAGQETRPKQKTNVIPITDYFIGSGGGGGGGDGGKERPKPTPDIFNPEPKPKDPKPPRPKPPKKPPKEPEPIRPIKPFYDTTTSRKQKGGIFTAQVRKGGLWVNIGRFGNMAMATSKAIKTVSGTARASFRIKKGNVTQPVNIMNSQFYPSKKERGVIIERRGKRIKSLGEKQEITYKGIFANRKSKKKGFWGF